MLTEIDESHLCQLPIDGEIAIPTSIASNEAINEQESGSVHSSVDDVFLSGTFVPMNFIRGAEKEIVKNSVREGQQFPHNTIAWPQIKDTPINEFKTEGYMTCAFPTLPHWCCRFLSAKNACCNNWELCQTLNDVQRWAICNTSTFSLFCTKY